MRKGSYLLSLTPRMLEGLFFNNYVNDDNLLTSEDELWDY